MPPFKAPHYGRNINSSATAVIANLHDPLPYCASRVLFFSSLEIGGGSPTVPCRWCQTHFFVVTMRERQIGAPSQNVLVVHQPTFWAEPLLCM
jgi:hypothetical protein